MYAVLHIKGVYILSELFIVIFASLGIGIFHVGQYFLFDSSLSTYFRILFGLVVLFFILRFLYYKIRFKVALSNLDIDIYDYKFYKTCNSLFNKLSYIISSFLYNTISEYKFTVKDFSITKNYSTRTTNDTEYYLKLRLRWYAYVRYTFTKTKIALKKADNFSYEHQNIMILKTLTPEDKEMYTKYAEKVSELVDVKMNILKLRKLENNNTINYIYRYNIAKIHNNNIKLKKDSDFITFLDKKSEIYANDIRTFKRSK